MYEMHGHMRCTAMPVCGTALGARLCVSTPVCEMHVYVCKVHACEVHVFKI